MNYFFKLKEAISAYDHQLARYLSAGGNSDAPNYFASVTYLGDWKIIIILALVASFVFWLKNYKKWIIPLWFVLGLTEAAVFSLKLLFHRSRPDIEILTLTDYSFPSGHSAIAVAFYGFLAYVYFSHAKSTSQKILIVLLGASLILLIGFSRIYLGVHFLSDVIGGYLIGFIGLLAGVYFQKKILPMFYKNLGNTTT